MSKFIRDIDSKSCIGYSFDEAMQFRNDRERAYIAGLNEFLNDAVECEINGVLYKVHPNVNLYLDTSPACPGDCLFCIAKVKFQRETAKVGEYILQLERALEILKPANPSIQVVGGEPSTYAGIYDIIKTIKKHDTRLPVLGTNAFGLDENLIDAMNKSNFCHVNISRCHYNDATNQEIMRFVGQFPDENIFQIGKRLRPRVRVQCNLIGGYIDTYGEVMQFIAYAYYHMAADNIVFAQLTPLPKGDYYQDSIIDYIEKRPVDMDSILEKIGSDSRFEFVKYRGGVACYYEVWEFTAYDKPVTIVFKFSDNKYLSQVDDIPEYIPDFVLHTDGTLCGSWNKDKKVILEATQ